MCLRPLIDRLSTFVHLKGVLKTFNRPAPNLCLPQKVDCKKGPASDKSAFADWIRELSAAFKPRGLLLSAAVSPSKKVVDEGEIKLILKILTLYYLN